MQARALRAMSIDEYVALDRSDESRWEYVNGEAYAMAGGSSTHALVAGNVCEDQWLSTFLRSDSLGLASLDVTLSIESFWRDLDRLTTR